MVTRLNVPDSINIRTMYTMPHQQTGILDAHYHSTVPITQAVLDAAAAFWVANIVPKLLDCLSVSCSIGAVEAVPDITPELIKGEATISPALAGHIGDEESANGLAAVLSLHTPLTGRSFRGRMYLPGMPKDQVLEDVIQPVLASAISTLITSLLGFDPVTGAGVGLWQVVSRKLGVSHHIIAAAVDLLVGYQRRRTRNRGHRHHV